MAVGRDALWASGHDESVEVNQRALIDKVLARYSGEFTVFRELLQNSDDAQSKAVEIRFESQGYLDRKNAGSGEQALDEDGDLPNLRTALVHQWTFKNNGIVFRDEDWTRLKKIAEGNPDEEKIGAFGVGFYSLFSVTEEPFVTSGGQWMGFYWKDKKDQLYARRGTLPAESTDAWTSFEMTLREDAPIPVAFDFTRFLASSITFMSHLSEISVYFDDKRLAHLTKASGIPRQLTMPKGLQSTSRLGIMNVKSIRSHPLHIKAEVMRWVYNSGSEKPPPPPTVSTKPASQGGFFSSMFSAFGGGVTPQRTPTPLPVVPAKVVNPRTISDTSVSLTIFAADVDVKLDKKIAAELHRSTKKNPPSKMKYELIYTAKEEYDASKKEDEQQSFATGSIFQGLRADLDGTGSARIFIGHATAQTTGVGGHMAARFIPTVERESIDLMDRNVAIWNRELLYVGGFLARAAYELELAHIKEQWAGASTATSEPSEELQTWLRSRSLHALKFFTFYQSTPSSDVSNLIEAAFFSCATANRFPLISSVGVRDASEIRLPDPTFAAFLKQLPVLPDDVASGGGKMITSLQNRQIIKAITFEDVLRELRARPLPDTEMIACLKWWIGLNTQGGDNSRLLPIRTELLNAAVMTIGESGTAEERIIPLSSIKTFINTRVSANIPLDGPLPHHLLPPSISKNFQPDSLTAAFPWTELSILEWLQHLCTPAAVSDKPEFDLSVSAPWAERVLGVLVRAWPSLSNPVKGEIVGLLRGKTCVPTSAGLKIPTEAYFANANIFHDLPVVTFPSGTTVKGPLERLLQTLGVRKHVELQVIFNRMIKTNEWTITDLIKYLVSVQSTLSPEEWERLRMTSAFSKESSAEDKAQDSQRITRYQASQLYEPLEVFRQLKLPIIDWGTQHKWRSSSDDAKFLFELGLLRFPPLIDLIKLCASPDANIRSVALKYLIDNINTKYFDYEPMNFANVEFIPALRNGTPCLGTPMTVFFNPDWAAFSLLVTPPSLSQDMATKLKIRQHPASSLIVSLLAKTPPDGKAEARKWFEILAGRVSEFLPAELKTLSTLPIVPTKSKSEKGPPLKWLSPSQCYFGSGGEAEAGFHSKLFVFVDFGPQGNNFLHACGTKREPSVEEVTLMLLADPHGFYELADGPTNFLNELRNIAVNSKQISSATLARMKKTPILLGTQRKLTKNEKAPVSRDLDEEEWDLQYDLKRPDQIVIADDTNAHQLFGDSLFTAPQEDILEAFYILLGSRRLSSLVKEEHKMTSEIKDSRMAAEIRALVLERLPLFLHEHTHAKRKISYGWLTTTGNLVVKTFGKLAVTKSLNFGTLHLSRTQDASAVASRSGLGTIHLWLAGNSQVDMYEVATSLNRLLFESPKANDALLFMTILSTDLKSLRRRGYNVDRILKQQKADRQAAEEARAKEENVRLMSRPPIEDAPVPPPKPGVSIATSSGSAPIPIPEKATAAPAPAPMAPGKAPRPASSVLNSLQNLKRKVGTSMHLPHSQGDVAAQGGAPHDYGAELGPPPVPDDSRPTIARRPGSDQGVTPLDNISSNIDMAINACRPESGRLLRNREEMRVIKESLDEGYCDVSGRVGDLIHVGEMGSVKIYVSHDVPNQQAFLSTKRDPLATFTPIIRTLASVYKLPLSSLHIFYDLSGGLIAFNRNGSIFLNLRYFEAWHDADVRKGDTNAAYVSWFFTLAHEIAHNLVQPHNSEHEFYFSAICEKHVMELGKVLK